MQRVVGRFDSDWQVATKRIFFFLTLDRKPRLRSQSYIGPTTVGPDTFKSTALCCRIDRMKKDDMIINIPLECTFFTLFRTMRIVAKISI